ncbi:MAG: molybdate ABC transporter permease subunit [Syntrophomonadaceae bacterium]|nr:molybdate ABC transporter permease subunit [Syntrophomonadaceae bacterium]
MFEINDWFPVWLSLKTAVISIIIVSLVGIPLARLMEKYPFRGRDAVESLLTLPLVLPPSVVGYGLLILIGKNGPLGRLAAEMGLTLVFSWAAVVLAATVVSFPLMYRSARAAFAGVNPNLEKAARTLGAGEARVFFTVSLPLAWPGIMSGLVLAFARALGEFGATLMVAGNIPGRTQTIPLAIYYAVETGRQSTVNGLVAIITIFCFVLIFLVNRWSNSKNLHV